MSGCDIISGCMMSFLDMVRDMRLQLSRLNTPPCSPRWRQKRQRKLTLEKLLAYVLGRRHNCKRVQPVLCCACNPILGVLQRFKTANVPECGACPLDKNPRSITSLRRERFQCGYFTSPSPSRTITCVGGQKLAENICRNVTVTKFC